MSIFTKPVLFVDTREQKPLEFHAYKEKLSGIVKTTLKAGDYTIHGKEGKIAFERKSLVDLVGSLTGKSGKDKGYSNRERFFRELELLKDYDYAAILIEAGYGEIEKPYRFSKANPKKIIADLQMISVAMDIDILFSATRYNSSEIIMKKIELLK